MFSDLNALLVRQFEIVKGDGGGVREPDFRKLEDQIAQLVRKNRAQAAYFCAVSENLYGKSEKSVSASRSAMKRLEAGGNPITVIKELLTEVRQLFLGRYDYPQRLLNDVMRSPADYLAMISGDFRQCVFPKKKPKTDKSGVSIWVSPRLNRPYVDLSKWTPRPVSPEKPVAAKRKTELTDDELDDLMRQMEKVLDKRRNNG